MEGSQNLDLEFEADSLINSNQLSENEDDPNFHDLEAVLSAKKGSSPSFGTDANVGLPQLHESRDPKLTKRNGRYNLRKSLAWDNAFFTSAGVLDQEELSTMITGTDEAKKHLLPQIEEDITRSTESISSLQSDNLTLDSHEDDLFLDIRASIQRSSKKASIFTNLTCKKPETEVDGQAISSLEKEDLAPQCKNSKLALKKTSGLQAVRTLKCQPKQCTGKQGSGRTLKKDSVQSQMTQVKSIAKIDPSTTVLRKPPKAIAKNIPNSTETVKRDITGAVAKFEVGSLKPAMVSSKGTQPPKAHFATGAGRVFSKPVGSSKSSSVGSSNSSMVQSVRLSTSSDSSSSISTKAPAKSLLVTTKRNPIKTSNVVTGSSISITKTPSRGVVKNKVALVSKLSAYVKSTKTSTTVSPASSISEWSSVSSSSSMVNPRSNKSRTSLDASSCKSMDSDIILPAVKNHFASPSVDGRNKEIALPGNNLKKASAQTSSLQAPIKPSGLRLPSPNFGYFGVNSRTPNKPLQSQSGSRIMFSKSEAAASTPNRSSNIKLKSSNVSTPTAATVLVNAKPALSKATPFASHKEKSHASGNEALVLVDIDDAPSLFVDAKDNAKGQHYHEAGEVDVVAGKQVIDAVMRAINENLGDLKKEMEQNDLEFGVMNIATSDGSNASGLEYTGQRGGGDALVSQNHLENNFYQLSEDSDKENGQAMYQGKDKGYNENINPSSSSPIHEVLSEILEYVTAFPAKASKSSPNQPPLAQNIFSGNEERISIPKESEECLSVEAKDKAKEQIYHKADEVEVIAGKQVIDAVMSAINEKLSDLKKETDHNNMEFGVLNIATLAGSNVSDLKYTGLERGEGSLVSQNHLENSFYQISEGSEFSDKENGQFIYQGEGIKEYDQNVNPSSSGPMHEVLSDILENVLSFSEKESSPNRTPLALKNISSNEECISMSKESEEYLSVEAKYNAKEQIYHKADEVDVVAGERVIDAVMSAINEKLSDLMKETDQNSMEFGVLNISTLAGNNASDLKYTGVERGEDALVSQNHLENSFYQISEGNESSDKGNGQMIYQGEGIKEYDQNVNPSSSGPMHEVLSDILEDVLSFPANASKSSPNQSPLALKKISGNEEHISTSKESEECLSVEAKDKAKEQIYYKADEVEVVAGKQVIDAVMSAINEKLSDLKKEMDYKNMEFGVLNSSTLAGSNASDLKYTGLEKSEDALVSHNHLENSFYQISRGSESSDKENGFLIYQGEGIKGYDKNVNPSSCGPMHEVPSDILENVLSLPAKASKSSPNRTPLALKNIAINDECISMSKGSDTQPDGMRLSALPSFEKKEN